jgi:hypothetical protein
MNKNSFVTFFFTLLGLSIVLYGLMFFVFTQLVIMPGMPITLMLLVLLGITALSHYIVLRAGDKHPRIFTYSFIGTSTGRLIVYSIFLLVYCFGHRDIAKVFVLTFFILYIIYTAFEVKSVQAYLKKK